MFLKNLIDKIKYFFHFKSDFSVLYEDYLPTGLKVRIVKFEEDENRDGIIFISYLIQVKDILNWHDVYEADTIQEAIDVVNEYKKVTI